MASQSGIAEGGAVVSADAINYHQKMFSHPSYRYEPQYPNTFGQPILLGASQTSVTINIPPVVFNLYETNIMYQVNLPAVAAQYIWTPQDTLAEVSHIQFYPMSTTLIGDVDNLQNYLQIVMKKETSLTEFMTLDVLNRLYVSDVPVNAVPALRNSITAVTNTPNGPANPSSINFTEPAYYQVGALAGAVVYNIQFPLRLIKNSIFSVNRNLYFGQTTYIKLYFGPLSKIAYSSTSNANPSAGVKSSYAGAASILNLQLMLAQECNADLAQSLIDQVNSVGVSMLIPFVKAFKTSNQGSSQNISIQFDSSDGRSLRKVIHAPYNNTEDLDLAYDHANDSQIAGVINDANLKVLTYYTQTNGKRNQDLTLDCTNTNGLFTDYLVNKRQLKGSVIANRDIYDYNWFHCDDFCEFGANYDQHNNEELQSGIPMTGTPLTWSFVGVTMRAVAFQHYTWAVFTRKLTMKQGTIMLE